MNTNKMNRRFTQHEAFSLIEEYFQSGQRATDFYRSKNMSEWQFYSKHPSNYLLIIPEHTHPRIWSDYSFRQLRIL